MFTNRGKALTFDDILLVPSFSEVTPDAVDISTWLTPSIELRIPLLSAAMDTVTESAMAISMARMGGIGIIHKNMPIERQRLEVERVKKSESGMILDPVTVSSRNSVQEALDLMADFRVSGLPVVDDGKLVGILTNRDVRFIEDASAIRVGEVMTSKNLVTVPMGTVTRKKPSATCTNSASAATVTSVPNSSSRPVWTCSSWTPPTATP